MNRKRLVLAIVAAFAGIWVTDFLIHGVWLANTYKATASLWRPEAEMQRNWGENPKQEIQNPKQIRMTAMLQSQN